MPKSNGFIAFMRPKTTQDKILARLDGGDFCHCELMVCQNPDGTWQTISSLPNTGVRIRNVTLDGDGWVKVPVQVDVDFCLAWYRTHSHEQYDFLGLLNTKLPFNIGATGKWFCSELVATLLQITNPSNYGIKALYTYANSVVNNSVR